LSGGPDQVEIEPVSFRSAGSLIDGRFYRLRGTGRLPAIVHSIGFMGVQDAIVPEYARALARAGYAALTFDYRGFGSSQGEPALSPVEQIRDLRSALSYLESRQDVDPARLGVFGDAATGSANALAVAALDPRVGCVVTVAALGDGADWLRAMRSPEQWTELQHRLAADRVSRATTGAGVAVRPIGDVLVPSPERERAMASGQFQPTGGRIPESMELAAVEELLAFKPVDHVHRIAPRAVMWMCFESDPVAPAEASRLMYERAGEPKKLVWLTNSTHYFRHTQGFDEIVGHALAWFGEHLGCNQGD
jgi:pimeloyl-ACP methyl ester carboxylesterase